MSKYVESNWFTHTFCHDILEMALIAILLIVV